MRHCNLELALLCCIVPTESWEPKHSSFVCHMANETTTTTLDDLTHTSLVQPILIRALTEHPGLYKFAREIDIRDQPTATAKLPTETSYWGAATDHGVLVDTEINATEATALSNTAFSTGNVTATAAEYGIAHSLTDNVQEDSIRGIDVLNLLKGRMLFVMALAWEDDYLALLASLSNTVGSTGVDLSVVQAIAAQQGLRTRGVDCDVLAYIFDNQQASDLEGALMAASTSIAVFAMAADRLIGYAPTANNGMNSGRCIGMLRGAPIYTTGLTDTANAGADVVGACLCPSTAYNDASGATTHAMVLKRVPTFETQRQAKSRSNDLVMTSRLGFGEIQDGSGTALITDA